MAVVGKDFALLEAPSIRLSGRLAWLVWAFIHIGFLPQIQNRLRVGVQCLWSYNTGQRSSRLITEAPSNVRRPVVPTDWSPAVQPAAQQRGTG
jgi:NADH dehydrogenase